MLKENIIDEKRRFWSDWLEPSRIHPPSTATTTVKTTTISRKRQLFDKWEMKWLNNSKLRLLPFHHRRWVDDVVDVVDEKREGRHQPMAVPHRSQWRQCDADWLAVGSAFSWNDLRYWICAIFLKRRLTQRDIKIIIIHLISVASSNVQHADFKHHHVDSTTF